MDGSIEEGFVPFQQYRTWYRMLAGAGSGDKAPLLCLHGGPGMTHDYLEPLEAIAQSGRRVIFYDQLGSGNSDKPDDPALWQIETFVDELAQVRKALGLDQVHLFGHSWGGFLGLEYMLTKPQGVHSLILSNSAASTWRWISEANRLRSELPLAEQAILDKHEADGTTDDEAYLAVTNLYYARHVCRMKPLPECFLRTLGKLGENSDVYGSMWGPSEFYCTGTLQNWDIEQRLGEIDLPTLILSGRYDESTPAINEVLQRGIRNSEWRVFEESSHTPHLEQTQQYIQVLSGFLDRLELH